MIITTEKTTVSFLKSEVSRRLFPNDVVFSHISFAGEHLVAFRMEEIPKAGELFGLAPIARENILVTAFYDMATRRARRTLELTVAATDREYRYEYLLTKEEHLMLTEKMDSFFRQRIGADLQSFSREQVAPS